jgi:hypothetical protein
MTDRKKPILEPTTQAFIDGLAAQGGKPITDLVTHSFNGFPVASADEFRQFLIALGTSGPGVAAPTPADPMIQARSAAYPVSYARRHP